MTEQFVAWLERNYDTDPSATEIADIVIVQEHDTDVIDGQVFMSVPAQDTEAWLSAPTSPDEHIFITADRELLDNGWETEGSWIKQGERWHATVTQTREMRFTHGDYYVAKFE